VGEDAKDYDTNDDLHVRDDFVHMYLFVGA